jgi:hypothetical protein
MPNGKRSRRKGALNHRKSTKSSPNTTAAHPREPGHTVLASHGDTKAVRFT